MNPKVDWYFEKERPWQNEFLELRDIVLACGLTEELKWGNPCYTLNKKNIVLIHGFKEYCALLFMKGAILKDEQGLLIQQTENVQAARQIRFTSLEEIARLRPTIKAYIENAIEVEKKGLKVELKKASEQHIPQEFQLVLEDNPTLKSAFYGLTDGRQRRYLLYFSEAKQEKTRLARIEKYFQKILDGKGFDD